VSRAGRVAGPAPASAGARAPLPRAETAPNTPAAIATIPLATNVADALQVSATQPTIGPPIAELPRKIVVYSAITRPRMSARVNRCSVELAVIANSIET
jgi:hypothetical protein